MLRLSSIAYWGFFLTSLALIFPLFAFVWLITRPFDRKLKIPHLFACLWGTFYIWACPLWSVKVVGRERASWDGPAVIVANHASLVDVLALFALFRPFRWVSKAENFKVPFIGWVLLMNDYVKVRRGDRESVARMVSHCRKILDMGIPVLLFPEGTRSRDGSLQPFRDGAFDLAWSYGCPVIPIALSGTSDALPKHGLMLRNRSDFLVEVLQPLDPSGYSSPQQLKLAARKFIGSTLSGSARRTA